MKFSLLSSAFVTFLAYTPPAMALDEGIYVFEDWTFNHLVKPTSPCQLISEPISRPADDPDPRALVQFSAAMALNGEILYAGFHSFDSARIEGFATLSVDIDSPSVGPKELTSWYQYGRTVNFGAKSLFEFMIRQPADAVMTLRLHADGTQYQFSLMGFAQANAALLNECSLDWQGWRAPYLYENLVEPDPTPE